jgi:flagellar hook-basal body complex protein FliE
MTAGFQKITASFCYMTPSQQRTVKNRKKPSLNSNKIHKNFQDTLKKPIENSQKTLQKTRKKTKK